MTDEPVTALGDLLLTLLPALDDVSIQMNERASSDPVTSEVALTNSSDALTDSDVSRSAHGAPARSEAYPSLQDQVPVRNSGAVRQVLQTDNDSIDLIMAELGSTDPLLLNFI